MTSSLNARFITTDVTAMLEGKGFSALDMVFPIICDLLDCTTRYEGQPILTEMNTIYAEIIIKLFYGTSDIIVFSRKSFSVEEKLTTSNRNAKSFLKFTSGKPFYVEVSLTGQLL